MSQTSQGVLEDAVGRLDKGHKLELQEAEEACELAWAEKVDFTFSTGSPWSPMSVGPCHIVPFPHIVGYPIGLP